MTTSPKLEQIINAMERQGHRVFSDPNGRGYDLNIVGIRTASIEADAFDDWLTVFFRIQDGRWQYSAFTATTDPGAYWFENPMHVAGTAIMVHGQCQPLPVPFPPAVAPIS